MDLQGITLALAVLVLLVAQPYVASPTEIVQDVPDQSLNSTPKSHLARQDPYAKSYRLPPYLEPVTYDIMLQPDLDEKVFAGSVRLKARVVQPTDYVVLHQGPYNFSRLQVLDGNERVLDVVGQDHNKTTEKFGLFLERHLDKDETVFFVFEYRAELRRDILGFYNSSYVDDDGKIRHLAATQFESTMARWAFPCLDESAFKATFKVTIITPVGYHAISNMPKKQTTESMVEFEESVLMSTYLVAFLVSDFKSLGNDKFRVWARPNAIKQADYALKVGQALLQHYEEYFGIPYQLEKMEMAAVPDFSAGAMENWGLILYKEIYMLYDEDNSGNDVKQSVANVIAHELAHQWFGNLVTPTWWKYLWLSESFAQYFGYMATAEVEPQFRMDDQFLISQYQSAMIADSSDDAVSMTRDAESQAEISKSGGVITYNKGASVLRMIETTLSTLFNPDVFKKSLRRYLNKMMYKSATPDDLWSGFQDEINSMGFDIPVKETFEPWTTQAGYPVIKVDVTPSGITLTQNRFLLRNLKGLPDNDTWSVPITWYSSELPSGTRPPLNWLTERSMELPYIPHPDEWLIINWNSVGYYRVNYDTESWKKIIGILKSDKFETIPKLNRASIIDDLMNLARANLVDYNMTLTTLKYLPKEKSYLPITTAINGLSFLAKRFEMTEDSNTFNKYVLSLIEDIYTRLTYEDQPNDDQVTILLRQVINRVACSLKHLDCVRKSIDYFSKWKSSGQPVPKNQRPISYCTAIKRGRHDDWEFLWDQYKKSKSPSDKLVVLYSLACTSNKTQLTELLSIALTKYGIQTDIHRQDVSKLLNSIYTSSPESAEFMLHFTSQNQRVFNDFYGDYKEVFAELSGIAQDYPSKTFIEQVNSLSQNLPLSEDEAKTLNKTLKVVNFELEWNEANLKKIIGYVKEILKEDDKAHRLPISVKPETYQLTIEPFIRPGNFTFNGKVIINGRVLQQTNEIVMHAYQLNISSIKIFQNNDDIIPIDNYVLIEKYQFLKISLDSTLSESSNISIAIEYVGHLNDQNYGLYRSSYKTHEETRWLAATHMEPTHARKMFPCFDEPALKANFSISVVRSHLQNFSTIVSNMDVDGASTDDKILSFKSTPPMSTYLVALLISDFPAYSSSENKYSVLANPNIIESMHYSLSILKPVVNFYEEHFKQPYSLPKLDMVALPDFSSGAMENWGLITYRETQMMYDEKLTSNLRKQGVNEIVAHEVLHQWFGNLVSPLWWDYLWLSEGFARYFQVHAFTESDKSSDLEAQFVVKVLQPALQSDSLPDTHSITSEVYTPQEIKKIFDNISYGKAACVIRMIQKIYPSVFYKALQNYLDKCKFSTGAPDILFESFDEELKNNGLINEPEVSKIMKSWTTNVGFPVLNVTLTGDSVQLAQSRFLLRPKDETDNTLWHIPLTWVSADHQKLDNLIWMNQREKVLEIKMSDWFIFNVDQIGFYRVNYDRETWKKIIAMLKSGNHEVIGKVNRAALIDDLFNLGRSGMVEYENVLDATEYLVNETDYIPWKAASSGFTFLKQKFESNFHFRERSKGYLLKLFANIYEKLGFDDQPSDSHTDKYLRSLVLNWMCKLENDDCVQRSLKLFSDYRDKKLSVSPNLRDVVYCTAIKQGSESDWAYLRSQFIKSVNPIEQMDILSGLACTQNSTLLYRLLTHAVDPESGIRIQDTKSVFSNVVDSGISGIETALSFIGDNYDRMNKYFGDDSLCEQTVSNIASRISSVDDLEKLQTFVRVHEYDLISISNSLRSSVKRATREVEWMDKFGPAIFKWLRRNEVPPVQYRLPTYAKPERYDIYLRPHFEKSNFTFSGMVMIDIKILNDTDQLELNAYKLNIDEVEDVTKQATIFSPIYDEAQEKLILKIEDVLHPGTLIKLKITYTGQLSAEPKGFYRTWYRDQNGNKRWLASTQFEPAFARRAFPCFDEPRFKAKFILHVSRTSDYHTLSNMPVINKERPDTHGRIWDDFAESVPMSTYTFAFVLSDFKSFSSQDPRVTIWARPESIPYLSYAAEIAPLSLKIMENITGMPYTLSKLDLVAVPELTFEAMENWGLITFKENALFYNENETSVSDKDFISTIIAHEIVHNWFGNLVTCDWWNFAWLNEGFAEYLQKVVIDKIEPSWELSKKFIVDELQIALQSDASVKENLPLNRNASSRDLDSHFDSLTYHKGSSVLRMFHQAFGDEIFFEALQAYLKKHRLETVVPSNLAAAFDDRLKKEESALPPEVDFQTILNSWTNQSGYPVVNVTVTDNDIKFSQERFQYSAGHSNEVYWVPITYTTSEESKFTSTKPTFWLSKSSKTVKLSSRPKWVIGNLQQTGYYRVNYDLATWQSIFDTLASSDYSSIPVESRAQIVDDVLNLARAGYLDYSLVFKSIQYLVRETEYLPWRSFFGTIAYLDRRLEGYPVKLVFNRAMKNLIKNNYDFNSRRLRHMDQLREELMLKWACKYGYEKCIETSKGLFAELKAQQRNGVNGNVASTVYCTSIRHGNETDWYFLLKLQKEAKFPATRETMLMGLGCSSNTSLIERYLDHIFSSTDVARRGDLRNYLSVVLSEGYASVNVAMDYMMRNVRKIHDYFGNWSEVGKLFKKLADYLSTEEQRHKLSDFAVSVEVKEISTELTDALASATSNLQWAHQNVPKIEAVFGHGSSDKFINDNESAPEPNQSLKQPDATSSPSESPVTHQSPEIESTTAASLQHMTPLNEDKKAGGSKRLVIGIGIGLVVFVLAAVIYKIRQNKKNQR